MPSTKNALKRIQKETKGLDRRLVNRFVLLAVLALWKADGTPTKFAKTYNIEKPEDLYEFLKGVKEDLKNDRESQAFDKLTDMSRSVFGRARSYFYTRLVRRGVDEEEAADRAPFAAHQFVLRTVGYALDNLTKLRGAFKHFTKELAVTLTR